jgi:hypothetical protein
MGEHKVKRKRENEKGIITLPRTCKSTPPHTQLRLFLKCILPVVMHFI